MPKRHPLRRECMVHYGLVFRDPTDMGKERSKTTPDPSVLTSNLDQFIKRWKDVEYNAKKVPAMRRHTTYDDTWRKDVWQELNQDEELTEMKHYILLVGMVLSLHLHCSPLSSSYTMSELLKDGSKERKTYRGICWWTPSLHYDHWNVWANL